MKKKVKKGKKKKKKKKRNVRDKMVCIIIKVIILHVNFKVRKKPVVQRK